jgi:aspartyl-tRNA synthetase
MIDFALKEGASGLAYIIYNEDGTVKSPIAKLLGTEKLAQIKESAKLVNGDAIFFACDQEKKAANIAGKVRVEIANQLNLIEANNFRFCWIVDFPYYELDEETGKIDFSHNPFSMPNGGMAALETKDPLEITAFQYDIVCNGIELSSGAIRNHKPEIMYKAFAIAGYDKKTVEQEFGGMIKAFQYGAPPHGGLAPGIDRMIMLLADTENIREIIAFPMNGNAQDLLMNAPNFVDSKQLQELNIELSQKALKIITETNND